MAQQGMITLPSALSHCYYSTILLPFAVVTNPGREYQCSQDLKSMHSTSHPPIGDTEDWTPHHYFTEC